MLNTSLQRRPQPRPPFCVCARPKSLPWKGEVARRNAETERLQQICGDLSVSLRLTAPLPLLSLRDISPDRGNRPPRGGFFRCSGVHPSGPSRQCLTERPGGAFRRAVCALFCFFLEDACLFHAPPGNTAAGSRCTAPSPPDSPSPPGGPSPDPVDTHQVDLPDQHERAQHDQHAAARIARAVPRTGDDLVDADD